MAEGNIQSMFHAALLNLDTAFKNFFRDPEELLP